ncbi:hypothetical protein DL93DRAFT_2061170 [Clavulina sp. PMI_390]|nr:hypothetical protein DL93DRAFT_2061170 [Clavulina sp. PMI_390]
MEQSRSSDKITELLRGVFASIRQPISDVEELEHQLQLPLDAFGLALSFPDSSLKTITMSSQHTRLISSIQGAVISNVVPHWYPVLKEDSKTCMLENLFCVPLRTQRASTSAQSPYDPAALEIALSSYSALLSTPITPFTLQLLPRLLENYPVDMMHDFLFQGSQKQSRMLEWDLLVGNVASAGPKIANAIGLQADLSEDFHESLRDRKDIETTYLLFREYSRYLYDSITAASTLLHKLIQIGLFPQQSASSLRPSFFTDCWNQLLAVSTKETSRRQLSRIWASVLVQLPSSSQRTFFTSLLSAIPVPHDSMSGVPQARQLVKNHAKMIALFSPTSLPDGTEFGQVVRSVLVGRTWDVHLARVAVCWQSGSVEGDTVDENALVTLSEQLLEIWSSPEHSQNPLVSRHQYFTLALMATWSYLPPNNPYVKGLATSPIFIGAVSKYVGNMDPMIRLLGMTLAEEVAQLSGRKLEFGVWDGDADGRPWIRELRTLVNFRDADVEEGQVELDSTTTDDELPAPLETTSRSVVSAIMTRPVQATREPDSDDDSLVGYDSDDASSRAPSPTPSELDEIERDPSLRTGGGSKQQKKSRPIYLVSLGELLRPSKAEGEEELRGFELALTHGEELVRRKRNFGTELEENAANLCIATLSLQNNYDIAKFEERRLGILIALVSCCPKISAPCLIEQFFHNQWSTSQRYAILNALALGARELAGLAPPPPSTRADFPSKMLPPSLHSKYLTESANTYGSDGVAMIADGITSLALAKGKAEAEEKVPSIIREKQLRIRPKAPSIIPTNTTSFQSSSLPSAVTFSAVAAEYFVVPLIEQFWTYLRDEQSREVRSRYSGTQGYHSAGTAMILDALTLKHFLATVSVLLHAARHSPAYLRILAPSALEIAGTVGSGKHNPGRKAQAGIEDDDPQNIDKENAVLAASLEIALVVLDACAELDGGKTLALEHTSLLYGTRDWASQVFTHLESHGGIMTDRNSGESVNRIRRAAAGVLLRIEEVLDQWRRSMISL